MYLKLNETSEIWRTSESDYKMAVFLGLKSRDHLTTLMIKAAVSSEILYTSTTVHDIAYSSHNSTLKYIRNE